MRRLVRMTTAAVLALGMMGSTAAVATPVPAGADGDRSTTGTVTMTRSAYPWVCVVFPRLPIC